MTPSRLTRRNGYRQRRRLRGETELVAACLGPDFHVDRFAAFKRFGGYSDRDHDHRLARVSLRFDAKVWIHRFFRSRRVDLRSKRYEWLRLDLHSERCRALSGLGGSIDVPSVVDRCPDTNIDEDGPVRRWSLASNFRDPFDGLRAFRRWWFAFDATQREEPEYQENAVSAAHE